GLDSSHQLRHGHNEWDGAAYQADNGLSAGTVPISYDSSNSGRVLVIYGSSSGLQVNNSTGRITLDPNFDGDDDPATPAGPLSPTELAAIDVVAVRPCTTGENPVCKMQLLASPGGVGEDFGYAVVGVPSIEGRTNESYDELIVSDPEEDWGGNNDSGTAYY